MDGSVTLGEIHRLVTRMDHELGEHRAETRDELRGIREHLRMLNSKTATHENKLAVLNNEVFTRPRQAMPPDVTALIDSLKSITGDNAPAFTRKDARLVQSTVIAIWVVGTAIVGAIAWVATHVKVVW